MDRDLALRHLVLAEKHLRSSEYRIERQAEIVAQAKPNYDADRSRRLLQILRELRVTYGLIYEEIIEELGNTSRSDSIGDVAAPIPVEGSIRG
jgi:hypothetical protein